MGGMQGCAVLLLLPVPVLMIYMTVIKHIGVLSVAKIEGMIGVVLGLILGIITSALGAVASLIPGLSTFAGFGVLSIVIFPIIYGILMSISGAIGAFLYNLFAGWVGGVDLTW